MSKDLVVLAGDNKEAALAASLSSALAKSGLRKIKHESSTIAIDSKNKIISIELKKLNTRALLFTQSDGKILKSIIAKVVKRTPQFNSLALVRDTLIIQFKY